MSRHGDSRSGPWLAGLFIPILGAFLLAGCGSAPGFSAEPAGDEDPGSENSAAQVPSLQEASLDTALAADLSQAFRGAAGRTLPAVVYVRTQRNGERPAQALPIPEPLREFFDMPEGGNQAPPEQVTGTGFLFDGDGHVMTNNHVVADAERILVRLHDGREFPAELVGGDPSTDVAVLDLMADGETLPSSRLGDSDALQVGDWVLALGNPLGLDFTVTAGIVSAKGRRLTPEPSALEAFIQTDAAINPGNSGGPLIDLKGRVMGINSAIFGAQRFVGYGFAVPINIARQVAEDLMEYGYVRRPRLGVSVSDVTAVDAEAYGLEEIRGAEINTVEAGSPADQAGLEVGDVVLALNGNPLADATALTTGLAAMDPGDQVNLTVFRDGHRRQVELTLGEFEPSGRPATTAEGPADTRAESWLGFRVQPLTPQLSERYGYQHTEGVVVAEVSRFGAAAQAGLRPGQLILEMEGEDVETVQDVRALAGAMESGSVVSLRVEDPELGETVINFRAWR